jgi:hypothetical protein
VGDCSGDGEVTVNELIQMVNIALGTAQVSACTAGDASGDGEITVNEIIAGVNSALNGCPPPPTGACGDGITNGTEECDPGGFCIGGTNAGTACTKEADCQGEGVCDTLGQQGSPGTVARKVCSRDDECGGAKCIHCKRFGGGGCAVNCTLEMENVVQLVPGVEEAGDIAPGTSGAIVRADNNLTLPLLLTGSSGLTRGKERNGLVPLVQKVTSVNLPKIPIKILACACVRGAEFKTCGGTQFEADGVTPSTNCSVPMCSGTSTTRCDAGSDCPQGETCVLDPCAGKKPCTSVAGPGNDGEGVVGCTSLPSTSYTVTQDAGGAKCSADVVDCADAGKAIITPGAAGGPGSQVLVSASALSTVVGLCEGDPVEFPAYGPDGEFCTDDDPVTARNGPSLTTLVTGTASAEVTGIQGQDGNDLGPFISTGNALTCEQAAAGAFTGGAQAGASTSLDAPTIGDIAVTSVFVGQ